jgi:squalene monooxygenase
MTLSCRAVQYEGDEVEIPYPPAPAGKGTGEGQTASGRVEGRAFVHGKFINALRKKAASAPNCLLIEGTVKDLVSCDDSTRVIGVLAALKPSAANPTPAPTTTLYAPLTIIADGCFSRFRPDNAPPPVTRSHFVGLVLEDAELPVPQHGNVVLGSQHGPILLYQIGTHETRMLVDVKGKLPSIGDGSLLRHLEALVPHLPPLLRPSVTASLERSQREGGTHRLRTMPNSWLPARQQGAPGQREGVIVVGDAWNMRHPLTGGGMSVALADVGHLVRILGSSPALPDLDDWERYAGQIASWHWQRKNLASVVNVLSVALYDLFGAKGTFLLHIRRPPYRSGRA